VIALARTTQPSVQPAAATLPAAVADSRRPLFLGPALRGRVDADGPALRVRAARRAEARFPLDRVSRVIANAHMSWSAEALRACLERAIPIVIMQGDGSPLGSVQPARIRRAGLAAVLEELLDWPDWPDTYRCWLRAARMRVLADWRHARQLAGTPVDPLVYQELVKKHVYRAGAASPTQGMPQLWRAAVYALAIQTIERYGAPALLRQPGGRAADLRRDLSELLELRLRLEVSQEAALKGEPVMLLAFHAITEKLEFEAGRALRSLARRVHQVLSEWR
jgi:hypothetical protein